MLAARSPYFAAMFNSGMSDARTSQLAFADIGAGEMRAVLHFIYNDCVDDELCDVM